MITIYQSSKGAVKIAEMNTQHVINAIAKMLKVVPTDQESERHYGVIRALQEELAGRPDANDPEKIVPMDRGDFVNQTRAVHSKVVPIASVTVGEEDSFYNLIEMSMKNCKQFYPERYLRLVQRVQKFIAQEYKGQ